MCHKNEKWELSPLINFMCGKNGSGKSAILTAIIICLGGKAAATGRGAGLKDFVRHGTTNASVTCYLKNQGPNAYRHDLYGDTIVVERHFNNAKTSSFKIKNVNGRTVVSTSKSDLDEILDHYCLQIENPLNILSQDKSREFMAGSTSSQKYKFFLQGVLLEQLDQDYKLIGDNIENMTPKIQQSLEDKGEAKTRWQLAERKMKESRKLDDTRKRLGELRHQCMWAQVEREEAAYNALLAEVNKGKAAITSAEQEVTRLNEQIEAAEEVQRQKDEAYETKKTEAESLKSAQGMADEDVKDKDKDRKSAHSEARMVREDLQNARKNVANKETQIAEEEARLAEIDGGGAARRLDELKDLEVQARDAKTRFEQREEVRAQLTQDGKDAIKRKAEADEKVKEQEKRVKEQKIELQKIQQSNSNLAGFRPGMERLIQAINKETRFHDRPIGPIAMHLKLSDTKWASIIEKQLGKTGEGFICTNKPDQDILFELGNRCGITPVTFIPPTRHIDISSQEPDQRFLTTMRALEIGNQLIRNVLILHGGLESAILVENFEEAQRVINDERPRNVKSCFTFMPENRNKALRLFYSQGTPAQDPVDDWNFPHRLRTNFDAQVQLRQQNVADEENRLVEYKTEFGECDRAVKAAQQAWRDYKAEMNDLQIAAQEAAQAVEDKTTEVEQDTAGRSKLSVLKEGLALFEQEVETKATLYGDAVNAQDQSKKEYEKAQQAYRVAERAWREAQSTMDQAKTEAQKADKEVKRLRADRNASTNRVDDRTAEVNSAEKDLQDAETRVADFTREVTERGSARVPIPEGETDESLAKKFEKLSEQLAAAQNRMGGNQEQIERRAADALDAYKKVKKDYDAMSKLQDTLKKSWQERTTRWKFFQQMIGWRARTRFIYLLSERGFRGKLIMDHRSHQLDLLVEPDITKRDGKGRNTRTLSGGEKSFAQICLLLALWEAMGSPLRCLDEFDVYMDAVNRTMTVNLLIHAARQSQGRQYIMISPGTKGDIKPAPDVHAFEVAPPERGQTRLSFPRTEAA
jgi:structural maintenance of chromosomes protein 6